MVEPNIRLNRPRSLTPRSDVSAEALTPEMTPASPDSVMRANAELTTAYARLSTLLDKWVFEPSEGPHRGPESELLEVLELAGKHLPAHCAEAVGMAESPQKADEIRSTCARRMADAAAVMFARGRENDGHNLLRAATDIARHLPIGEVLLEARTDRRAYVALVHAWWLIGHERPWKADRLARPLAKRPNSAIGRSAQALLSSPMPVLRVPSLFTLNGFGTRLVGSWDHRSGELYIATLVFAILFLPVVPIARYRVLIGDKAGQYYFLERLRLTRIERWWQGLSIAALGVGLACIIGVGGYAALFPPYQEAIARARSLEATDPEAAIAAYREAAMYDAEMPRGAHVEVSAGMTRMLCQRIPTKPTMADLPAIEGTIAEMDRLPDSFRVQSWVDPFAGCLLDGAQALIDATSPPGRPEVSAALSLVEHARKYASEGRTHDLEQRRLGFLKLGIDIDAEQWPLESIASYLMLGLPAADDAAAARQDRLSLDVTAWAELAPSAEQWAARAPDDPRARAMSERTAAARLRTADPQRLALLESGDETALVAALAAARDDHGIAAALALIEQESNRANEALARLEALGPDGTVSQEIQTARVRALIAADRLPEALDRIERLVAAKLERHKATRAMLEARWQGKVDTLFRQINGGTIPEPWRSRFAAAPTQEVSQAVFAELLELELAADHEFQTLRALLDAQGDVLGLALGGGGLAFEMAMAMDDGSERIALMNRAERAYLSVLDASGDQQAALGGLAKVYFRLGRVDDANTKLSELLAGPDRAEATFQAAHVLRDLGKTLEAKKLLTALYDEVSEPRVRYRVAAVMSAMAGQRSEVLVWVERSDPDEASTRRHRLSLEGQLARARGSYEQAAEAFRREAEEWVAELASGPNAVASNNAALAFVALASVTGDKTAAERAETLMIDARRSAPDGAILASNQADVSFALASTDLGARWFRLAAFRPTSTELDQILVAMSEGPRRDELARQVRANARVKRGFAALHDHNRLAPHSANGLVASTWSALAGDVAALEREADRMERYPPDLSDLKAQFKVFREGAFDSEFEESATLAVERFGRALAEIDAAREPATAAAIRVLLASAEEDLANLRHDPDAARRAVEHLERAREIWPPIGATSALIRTQQVAAIVGCRALEPARADTLDAGLRARRTALVFLSATEDASLAACLRGGADLEGLGALVGSLPDDAIGLGHVVLALFLEDKKLAQRLALALDRPLNLALDRISIARDVDRSYVDLKRRVISHPWLPVAATTKVTPPPPP